MTEQRAVPHSSTNDSDRGVNIRDGVETPLGNASYAPAHLRSAARSLSALYRGGIPGKATSALYAAADQLEAVLVDAEAIRADEREQWASYFENADESVGHTPLTYSIAAKMLRGHKPFGVGQAEKSV